MSIITDQAIAKINEQLNSFKGGNMAMAVSKPVADVLKNFCEDERFASAIVKSKDTLSDCCKAIMSDVRGSISDLEVYKRAAEFYFPTSTVLFKMEICLDSRDDQANYDSGSSGNIISLLDLI